MIHEKQIEEIRAMTPEQRLEVYRDLMHAADTWLASLEPEEARRRFKLMNTKRAWVTKDDG